MTELWCEHNILFLLKEKRIDIHIYDSDQESDSFDSYYIMNEGNITIVVEYMRIYSDS